MSGLILPSRRLFLGGLIAAPVVIAANRLMPVKSIKSFDLVDMPSSGWVLVTHESRLGGLAWMPKTKFETLSAGDLDYAKHYIVKHVDLPERTNYRNVHAGTELLKIRNATIIV